MWLKSVGPEWFMYRSGIDWRPNGSELTETKAHAFIGHSNSLSEEALLRIRSKLPVELQRPAGSMMVDPPFGRDMHKGSCLDLSDPANNWDDKAWSGDDYAHAMQLAVTTGFVKPEHVAFLFCGIEKLNEVVAATAKIGYNNHQFLYCEKTGHSR